MIAQVADFSGRGAAQFGSRWNHPEHPAVYFGLTPAICALEMLMHSHDVRCGELALLHARLPDHPALYRTPGEEQLPLNWNAMPADTTSRDFGTRWLRESQQLGLILPSSIMPQARLMMLDPGHPAACQLEVLEIRHFHFPG